MTSYHRPMGLVTDLGMRPLIARCNLGRGRLYRRTSNPQQAQEYLAIATTMYREMAMRFWLAKADAEQKA